MVRKSLYTIFSLLLATVVAAVGTHKTVPADPKRFTYTSMKTPLSGPCDVAEGPDGLVYVQELFANKIARYNQHTGELTEFDIPFTTPLLPNLTIPVPGLAKTLFLTCAFRNGFDGYLYLSNGNRNQLVRHDVHSNETVVFTPPGLLQPLGNLQPLNDITTAPDGVYFSQTTANVITHFDYKTHKFRNFPIPTLLSLPLGVYYASDGGIWFLELLGNKVGRLDRTTGQIKEYPLPALNLLPAVMRAETQNADGDYILWFAVTIPGALGSINERTGEIFIYTEPTLPSTAVEVARDYSDNIWISHLAQNTLGVFNPTTEEFTEVIMPETLVPITPSLPLYVGTGIYCKPVGNPVFGNGGIGNAIWFTQLTANRLVRFDIEGLKF